LTEPCGQSGATPSSDSTHPCDCTRGVKDWKASEGTAGAIEALLKTGAQEELKDASSRGGLYGRRARWFSSQAAEVAEEPEQVSSSNAGDASMGGSNRGLRNDPVERSENGEGQAPNFKDKTARVGAERVWSETRQEDRTPESGRLKKPALYNSSATQYARGSMTAERPLRDSRTSATPGRTATSSSQQSPQKPVSETVPPEVDSPRGVAPVKTSARKAPPGTFSIKDYLAIKHEVDRRPAALQPFRTHTARSASAGKESLLPAQRNAGAQKAPPGTFSIKDYLAIKHEVDRRPAALQPFRTHTARSASADTESLLPARRNAGARKAPPATFSVKDDMAVKHAVKRRPILQRSLNDRRQEMRQDRREKRKQETRLGRSHMERGGDGSLPRGRREVLGSGTEVRVTRERLAETGSTDREPDKPSDLSEGSLSDALVRAEAEALLDSLRSLPSTASAKEELTARVRQGLIGWAHLASACEVLAEEVGDQQLLLDVLSSACEVETDVRFVSRKWALVTEVIEKLVDKKSISLARKVPSCWPSMQPTSRAQATKALMSALMRAEAYRDATEVFVEGLGEGLPLRQMKEFGMELVGGLVHTKQYELAGQLTEDIGRKGDYAPFLNLIKTLASEKLFLEAFYTLDVYCKAVEKPDEGTLEELAAQYAEHGYEQTGLEFLAFVTKASAVPHPRVSQVLVRSYGLAKLPNLAEKVVEAMGGFATELDTGVRSTLASAYLDAGDVIKARGLLQQTVEIAPGGGSPELARTLERLIGVHALAGEVFEGWEVLRWMDMRSLRYDIDSLTLLFEAVLREGGGDVTVLMDAFEAHRRFLRGQVAAAGAATLLHKSLFQFLTSKGLLEDAVAVFAASVEDGVTVPLTNCVRLILDLIEAGHPEVALGVLRGAPEMEREYPRLYYKLLDRLAGQQPALPAE
jgi:hypothetical protein